MEREVIPLTDDPQPQAAEVTVHVCVTCRAADDDGTPERRPGWRLHAALTEAVAAGSCAGVQVVPVECLSVCKRPCTVAVSAPGRWTYVYGDLDPETGVDTILDGVRRYAEAPAGIVPWRERPEPFRKGVIARIPPRPE
jgi:predicted metal-binding protein